MLNYILSCSLLLSFTNPLTFALKNPPYIVSCENLDRKFPLMNFSEILRSKYLTSIENEAKIEYIEDELKDYMQDYEHRIKKFDLSENDILYLSFVYKALYEGIIYYMQEVHHLRFDRKYKKFVYYNFCKDKLKEIVDKYTETHPDFSINYYSSLIPTKLCATSFWFIFGMSYLCEELSDQSLINNNCGNTIFKRYIQQLVDVTCKDKTFEIKSIFRLRSR